MNICEHLWTSVKYVVLKYVSMFFYVFLYGFVRLWWTLRCQSTGTRCFRLDRWPCAWKRDLQVWPCGETWEAAAMSSNGEHRGTGSSCCSCCWSPYFEPNMLRWAPTPTTKVLLSWAVDMGMTYRLIRTFHFKCQVFQGCQGWPWCWHIWRTLDISWAGWSGVAGCWGKSAWLSLPRARRGRIRNLPFLECEQWEELRRIPGTRGTWKLHLKLLSWSGCVRFHEIIWDRRLNVQTVWSSDLCLTLVVIRSLCHCQHCEQAVARVHVSGTAHMKCTDCTDAVCSPQQFSFIKKRQNSSIAGLWSAWSSWSESESWVIWAMRSLAITNLVFWSALQCAAMCSKLSPFGPFA